MKKVVAAYFSPTGNSKKYVTLLAEKIDIPFDTLDFTKKENRRNDVVFSKESIVLFSAPVYAGRLPNINLFDNVKGNGAYAVCIVTYGNREYDDALLELKNICEQKGFQVVAAAAFIGEHTYSEYVGANRPNEQDDLKIEELAEYIKSGISKNCFEGNKLQVKGNEKYCEHKAIPLIPQPNEKCSQCGSCARKCPVGAIDEKTLLSDSTKCISCFACVKGCTKKAREVKENGMYSKLVEMLETNLRYVEKEAEIFLLK